MDRKDFFKSLAFGAGITALEPNKISRFLESTNDPFPAWQFTSLRTQISEPVKIQSIEMWRLDKYWLMVVKDANNRMGITQCNDRMPNLISLLKGIVAPHFLGQDARDLPQLVDNAYRLNSNYKYSGMPLWNCIGSLEIACWDLLGRVAQKPAHALLGTPVRTAYDVYISDWSREGDTVAIAEMLLQKLRDTGARGVKIKIGGRMVNTAENEAQTRRYIPTLRKVLGDNVTIYADANGSYSPDEGIRTGKLLEDYGVAIFEEPCNFEDEEGMRRVTKALKKIVLAGGEQDSSLYRFDRLARTNVYDLLQPDLYYNGGIMRALTVSNIAKKYGKAGIAPHTPKADPLIAPFWQVAALAPNLYGFQECVYESLIKKPTWYTPEIKIVNGKMPIPNTPGLGLEYDDAIFKSATKVDLG